jgi:hypothetical protein
MTVTIYLAGRKLRDRDTFSKSDPRCLVTEILGGKSKAA